MRWIVRALAAAFVLAAGMGQAQAPAQKLALVVGVSDYGRERAAQEAAGFVVPPPLANAVRDAELVASALESKGFTVTRVTNPDKRALLSSVNAFAAALGRAGPDAVGLFYFAGHGAQGRPALERDIDNYLIPLGADLATEVDLESEALALSRISAALRPAPQGAVVLILDACRDFALPAASRSGLVTRGLAEARAAPGTIIAYATSPGATALDALPGQSNGPYATALAAEIRAAQGARLEDVFIGTRNKVLAATRNTQTPWENGSLRRAVMVGVAPVLARAPVGQQALTAQSERVGQVIRDCDECPELIVLPGGAFRMGSDRQADERPVRNVTLRSFAIGTTEVTVDQWKAFQPDMGVMLSTTRCDWRSPGYQQEGNHPVVCVTWNDARSYAAWLTERTGRKYFLPSEAQWEYAARAGSETPYPWGAAARRDRLNYGVDDSDECDLREGRGGCPGRAVGGDRWVYTAPVKSFPANAFGIYDMHGNVREWTQDCHFTSYVRAPTDGGPYNPSTCGFRVMRGGSFKDIGSSTTSTYRNMRPATQPEGVVGFRIAREVY